jgi:predicted extracellular nuclease
VIVLGDLNDFEFSGTAEVLEQGAAGTAQELFNLWGLLPRRQRYSYDFQGNAQVLDHILVTESLMAPEPELDAVHMNSELTEQQSDHDPPLARFRVTGGGG